MANVVEQSQSFIVNVTVSAQSIALSDNLFAVRLTRTTDGEGDSEDTVMDGENLKLALANKPFRRIAAYWLTPDEREELSRKGGMLFVKNSQIEKRSVFECAQGMEGGVIRANHYDSTWYEADGTLIPVGIHFCYMDGLMDNEHYNLDLVLEILSLRDDITWVGQKVKAIPHYNASETRDRFVEFWWTPSLEQYKLYRERDAFSRHAVVFDHDMLGLREAALTETYYGED